MVIVQQSAEARATGDLAICSVVIRRTDVPDQLATKTLVKTLGHVVIDEFLDQIGIGLLTAKPRTWVSTKCAREMT